jgi:hypothetical protein
MGLRQSYRGISVAFISSEWHFAVWASMLAAALFGLWAETCPHLQRGVDLHDADGNSDVAVQSQFAAHYS